MEIVESLIFLNEFFNKRILITGHTGFKGSWLSIWLDKLGAKVTGYSLDPTNQNDNYILSNISSKITDFRFDIRDYTKFNQVVKESNPEVIFHLAAQPLVLTSYEEPLSTIDINIKGTANVLEAFKNSESAKVLVVITTDKVYKNNKKNSKFIEDDILGGNDLYSASKAATELLCNAYNKSFFTKQDKVIATVRAGNVIGGGDWSDNRIVPDSIKAIENNHKIIIRNPKSIRPWQHVLEPLGGYLLLASNLLKKNTIVPSLNFGPESSNEINVEYLVNSIINKYGKGDYEIKEELNAPKESSFLSLNIDKAKSELGWEPLLTFEETIDFTIEWYKEYKTSSIYDLCIKQINKYEEFWKSRN